VNGVQVSRTAMGQHTVVDYLEYDRGDKDRTNKLFWEFTAKPSIKGQGQECSILKPMARLDEQKLKHGRKPTPVELLFVKLASGRCLHSLCKPLSWAPFAVVWNHRDLLEI